MVIDPGHGGEELGTQGTRGTLEKEITLALSRRLRTLIESRLGLKVFLTREDDRTLSLDERSAFANNHRADVMLSIHANYAVRPALKGAEVYYLTVERADEEARKKADANSTTLPALGGGSRAIDFILWETAQARYLEQSAALAGFIEQALATRVEMSPRAVQQAPFRVLVGANMPAALVEIGYLSNSDQETLLATAAYQEQVRPGTARRAREVPEPPARRPMPQLAESEGVDPAPVGGHRRHGSRDDRVCVRADDRPKPPAQHAHACRRRGAGRTCRTRGAGRRGRAPHQGHALLCL